MGSFSILEKTMTSVIQLEIDAALFHTAMEIVTPVCKFDGLDDTEWSVTCNTLSYVRTFNRRNVVASCLELKVNQTKKDKTFRYCVTPNGSDQSLGMSIKHDDLRPFIVNGKIGLKVTATYHTAECHKTDASHCKLQLLPFELVEHGEESLDLQIIVGKSDPISVHKAFLSTYSPVFKAMFNHNTKEAQTGIIDIKDFDHATVKAAIDLLYGHVFEPKSIHAVLELLRFAEKYIIKAVIIRLEAWLNKNITIDNLETVIHHAWDHSNDKLKEICAQIYRQHMKPKLQDVDPAVIVDMIQLSLT